MRMDPTSTHQARAYLTRRRLRSCWASLGKGVYEGEVGKCLGWRCRERLVGRPGDDDDDDDAVSAVPPPRMSSWLSSDV